MTLTFQQQVTAFMEALGFVHRNTNRGLTAWFYPSDGSVNAFKPTQAAFMYRQKLIGQREELTLLRENGDIGLEYRRRFGDNYAAENAQEAGEHIVADLVVDYIDERIAAIDQLIKQTEE